MAESQPPIDKRFDRLLPKEIARLEAALDGDDVLVKGLHTKGVNAYRGGCLPYVGLAVAGLMGTLGAQAFPALPLRGAALGLALAAIVWFVRAGIYARLSRRLLTREGGWLALGWTKDRLVYRSFDACLLVSWADVERVEIVGDDAPKTLRGTLWVHLGGRRRVLIQDHDGALAGRPMTDWARDLEAAKGGGGAPAATKRATKRKRTKR